MATASAASRSSRGSAILSLARSGRGTVRPAARDRNSPREVADAGRRCPTSSDGLGEEDDAEESVLRRRCRSPIRRRRARLSRGAGRARSLRRSRPAAATPSASRRTPPSAPRTDMPSIALRRAVGQRRRARAARRGRPTWCDRSPVSAAAIAYCIGPGLHSRPSASFLIARAHRRAARCVRPPASPRASPARDTPSTATRTR